MHDQTGMTGGVDASAPSPLGIQRPRSSGPPDQAEPPIPMIRSLASAAGSLLLLILVWGCDEGPVTAPMTVENGDAERGRIAIERRGCGACHKIPGIRMANANVGPPLTAMRRQSYIAGILPNYPEHMVRWIMNPPAVDPRTAMPDDGIGEAEARDIAAYLYEANR